MAEYYLMSQLPSLDGIGENTPLPITEERFSELCHRFLGEKAIRELDRLTLLPPREYEKSSSSLIESWNEGERKLRLALGKVRADKMNKDFITKEMLFLNRKKEEKKQRNKHIRRFGENNKPIFSRINK